MRIAEIDGTTVKFRRFVPLRKWFDLRDMVPEKHYKLRITAWLAKLWWEMKGGVL